MFQSNIWKLQITHGEIIRWYAYRLVIVMMAIAVGFSTYLGATSLMQRRAGAALHEAFEVLAGRAVLEDRTSERYVVVTQANEIIEERYEK